MLVHGMTLLSFGLFRKNLGNLRELFGQKFARTPMKMFILMQNIFIVPGMQHGRRAKPLFSSRVTFR